MVTSPVTPLVSIVIPVFNCEDYLRRCLNSVYQQTYTNFEVIAVNDGSVDTSWSILEEYSLKYGNFTSVDQVNQGQGVARNLAMSMCRGEWILFVDADDFIEPTLLQMTLERGIADNADLVHFDWKLGDPAPLEPEEIVFNYYNTDPFWHKPRLVGSECEELLRVKNLYAWSNLYRRSFLANSGAKFEEGRIYEDNPFLATVIRSANIVSLVHAPLYALTPNPTSTTRSHVRTDKHYRDHIHAIRASFTGNTWRSPHARTYLAAYHTRKFANYYWTRVPVSLRRSYAKEFTRTLHEADLAPRADTSSNRLFRLSDKLRVFEKQRVFLFEMLVTAQHRAHPVLKRLKIKLRVWKDRNSRQSIWSARLDAVLKKPVKCGSITFLGFDFKYQGNSRYLFEEMIVDPRFSNLTIKFVTSDKRVPANHRLSPGLLATNEYLARSEVVIAESWVPPQVRKHENSTWIQLWHGTPIKRLLFDTHERKIAWRNRKNKNNKFSDIQRWDYLVTDSKAGSEKLLTAFQLRQSQVVQAGYPRVKFLIDSDPSRNSPDKQNIRDWVGLDKCTDKKVLLYAPTWRDYNYGAKPGKGDYNYVLDVDKLARSLGDDYVILFHDHGYISSSFKSRNYRCIDASKTNIQNLLLISDVVISDYSSVVFDALSIDIPFLMYAPDQDLYEEYRGTYKDIWNDLNHTVTSSFEELLLKVRGLEFNEQYEFLKNRYAYSSEADLLTVVSEVLQKGERSRGIEDSMSQGFQPLVKRAEGTSES
ncbi:bifunctional glycosyltransferase/CDP-glycerol:glycerophosphate glycerophosphotransferase [Leucobacter sp. HY1910]